MGVKRTELEVDNRTVAGAWAALHRNANRGYVCQNCHQEYFDRQLFFKHLGTKECRDFKKKYIPDQGDLFNGFKPRKKRKRRRRS